MACIPRTRPSVGCSAIVRTRPSPMCCCTSQMISIGVGMSKPSLMMRIAVCTRGIWPSGNSQSTAGPDTTTTLPVTTSVVTIMSLLRRRRAAYHFDDFLGDAGLAYTVHIQSELIDHFRRVGGGGIHRCHTRRVFTGGGFQQRPVEFHFHVLRKQRVQHLPRGLFEDVVHGVGLLRQFR